jgi:hypothetical protein
MSRPRSPRELVATLIACVESDEDNGQELNQLLAEHSSELAVALHKPRESLLAACMMAPAARCARIHTFVKLAKERDQAVHARMMVRVSLAAAEHLVANATWQQDRVLLSADEVLGRDLLADRIRKYIRFEAEDLGSVVIPRDKLSATRRALRFSNVSCWLDETGLHFGWRGGKGGLLLRSRPIPDDALDAVLPVVIGRPRPAVILTAVENQLPILPTHCRVPFQPDDVWTELTM